MQLKFPAALAALFFPAFACAAFLSHGLAPPLAPNLNGNSALVVTECDSLTQNNASGVNTYPAIYSTASTLGAALTVHNSAIAGNTLASAVGREDSNIALIAANPGKTHYVYSLFCVANNTSNPTYYPDDAAAFVSATATLLDYERAGGFDQIIIATMPDFSFGGSVGEAWRAQVNTGLRALVGSGHADVVADFAGGWLGYSGSCGNTLWFLDCLHYTAFGQQAFLEREFARAVNGLAHGSTTPGDPTAFIVAQQLQTALYLQWEPPATGGLYTDFTLEYKLHSDSSYTTWAHDPGSRQWTAQVTGLTPGTSYDLRVKVTGPGGSSAYATLTTSTETLTPGTFDVNRTTQTVIGAYSGPILSSDNTIATHFPGSGFPAAACTSTGKTSGKWYLEFLITGSTSGVTAGLADDGAINTSLGSFSNSVIGGSGPSTITGSFTAANTVNRAPWPLNTRGMMSLDMDAGKAWIGQTNTWTNAGGTPDIPGGTLPWITWTPDGRKLYPCFGVVPASTGVQYIGSGFTYTPPAGFSALN